MNFNNLNKKISQCLNCELCQTVTNVVPGEGNPKAKLVFIGEAPGRNEDLQGRPFVGSAGKLLNQLIKSINLSRKEVFITSILKCRPPKNRDPKPKEIEACWPWLLNQLKEIKPQIIVTLGRHSLNRFLPKAKISKIHGQTKTINLKTIGQVTLFISYHPAAAIYNQKLKSILIKDFQKLSRLLN